MTPRHGEPYDATAQAREIVDRTPFLVAHGEGGFSINDDVLVDAIAAALLHARREAFKEVAQALSVSPTSVERWVLEKSKPHPALIKALDENAAAIRREAVEACAKVAEDAANLDPFGGSTGNMWGTQKKIAAAIRAMAQDSK